MRAGRVGGWCGLLWIDGIGRNEAHHGASPLLHTHTAPFTPPRRVLNRFSFSAARLWVAWARSHCPSHQFPQGSPSFSVPRCGIPRWPYNWFNALARNTSAHHGSHRGTRPRVPPAYRQKSRRPHSAERHQSCARFLWRVYPDLALMTCTKPHLTGEKIGSLHQYRQVGLARPYFTLLRSTDDL